MKIAVRLVSIGGGAESASADRDVPDGASVADVVGTLGLPADETFAVLVNDMPVSPGNRAGHILEDGDRVTVFPPIRGG